MKVFGKARQIVLLLLLLTLASARLTLAQQPADDRLFLPLVTNGSGGNTTPTPQPTPQPTLTPTPQPTQQPNLNDEFPQQGVCPTGFHPVDQTGSAGILGDDVADYQDTLYTCLPDDTADLVSCGVHGTAQVIEGVATCACQSGYGGEGCNLCLPGFEQDSAGACVPSLPQPTIEITSSFESLEAGQMITLTATTTATDAAGGPFTQFQWSLPDGAPGCLITAPGAQCSNSVSNQTTVFYVAPSTIEEMDLVEIGVAPVPTPQAAASPNTTPPKATKLAITILPSAGIPVTGSGDARLLPIVRAVRDFMHYRCVGAGVVGISYYGKPIGIWGLGRMNGRAELNAPAECGDNTINPYNPNAGLVLPNTPFRLGSVSKSVMAAVTRLAVEAQWKKFQPGVTVTQEMIEALPLLGGQAQVGTSLLPTELVAYYNGAKPVPWVISPELGTVADPRWKNATVGHMLAHRGGLPRSAPQVVDITPNLYLLRGLTGRDGFQAEQNKLINRYGATVVNNARATLATALGVAQADVYLLPAVNLNEILVAVAGRALSRAPGEGHEYSNTDPAYWLMITEKLTGRRFVANQGDPNSHTGSLLHEFFLDGLGVNTTGNSGIFVNQAIWPPVGLHRNALSRDWDQASQSYYPLSWDTKYPHCVFGTNGCSFTAWNNPTDSKGTINYSWQMSQVPFPVAGTVESPGTGNLLSEARTFLRFMASYWVGGYDANPRIGEKRNGQWNLGTAHNGSLGGSFTYAIQLGSDTGTTLNLPPRLNNGKVLADDFSAAKVDQIRLDVVADKLYITYNDQTPKTVDVTANPGDKVAIGYASTEGRQSIFHAQTADGKVTVRTPNGELLHSFGVGFVAGSALAVANIDQDTFDEVFVAKPSTNNVAIYEHTGSLIRQLAIPFADGERMVVGDIDGNGTQEIVVARSNGNVEIYRSSNGSSIVTVALALTANDGLAMGNVLGVARQEELVIGRKSSGKIDIYNWDNTAKKYSLFTTIPNAGYDHPAGLTVARFHNTQHRILVGRVGNQQMNAYVNVPDADDDNDDVNDYLTFKQDTLWSPLFHANLLFAGGHLTSGFAPYTCSNSEGTIRKMPAGVDIFVAINQTNSDRACLVNGNVDADGNCNAYSRLYDFALYGVCQINWSLISPQGEVKTP